MINTIIEWFKNLSEGWQIAIFGAVVTVSLAAIGGLFVLIKGLFGKKDEPPPQSIKINTGIDPNNLVDLFGKTKEELGQANERIRHLEEQLAKPRIETSNASEQSTPMPSVEAKELAKLITENDGPYAQALKAIAEGNNKKADGLLDETQKIIDQVRQIKNEAQAKIYMARMQNASYAGRPRDALQWCDKLKSIAGEDLLFLNDMAVVYYDNANYKEAELLYKRALAIREKSLVGNHPDIATVLNNLAALYKVTNRFSEAEPLMKRALAIDEASLGKGHPKVAADLNNLAQLYKATNRLSQAEPLMKRAVGILENPGGEPLPNYAGALSNLAELYRVTKRLSEAEPMYKRALAIDEASLGKDHPKVAIRLNNLGLLYQDTNRLSEAEPMYKRALAIFEKSLGPNHPSTITVRKNWDNCREKM
jgi:tetratricopeptide (TPR) repeat protein